MNGRMLYLRSERSWLSESNEEYDVEKIFKFQLPSEISDLQLSR